jgi:hypothetical protein
MDIEAKCRIQAAEFLVQAKREPEREAHLISMAESWLRLAIKAEQIQALKANNARAPIGLLSLAKRTAMIEGFNNNNGLHKRNGCWCGAPEGKHISGVTVADLARDGMFSVVTNRSHGSARLTERGQWFARTLIDIANEVQVRG